jgi:phosphomannomutase/phosphoglucomutase
LSSDAYHNFLIKGLNSSGIDTIDIGLCATPMLYFSIRNLHVGGGVMITGSHNPPEFNGFKICIGQDTIYGEQIQELRKIMESGEYLTGSASSRTQDISADYENYLFDHSNITGKIKIAVDGGNGVGGHFALPLLKRLGCEVIPIYCEPDGHFPHHFPDPTVKENLVELIKLIASNKADLGIAFDGDADRLGVISDNGEIIWGDKLLLLFARQILAERPDSTIIGEVKCSQVLFDDIKKHSDRYFGYDDGIYAAIRLLEILSQTGKKISELFSDVPKTYTTPEIRVDCTDDKKTEVVERIKKHFEDRPGIVEIDGIRIPFEDGWALVRSSNTQPVIVLRFEASSEESLQRIRNEVEPLLTI